MTTLYVKDREALSAAILLAYYITRDNGGTVGDVADVLLDNGQVKVIDPDDDALVKRVTQVLSRQAARNKPVDGSKDFRIDARAVLRALVEDTQP